MKIVLIGTGNVAVLLSKKLTAAGHDIVQVFGRNHIAAEALAKANGASFCSSWHTITQHADLYILALSDQALTGNSVRLQLTDQLVVHTAGAVSIEMLKNISSSYGVMYPLQTIRKEVEPLPDLPLLVDGNTDAVKQQLMALGETIAGTVMMADDMQRMQYHICAIITNNFSNYLYTLAEAYCNKHDLKFSMLLPLIDETARRLHRFSPRQVQTGPAIRKDAGTIRSHLTLLKHEPALAELYKVLSDGILQFPW